MFKTAEYSEAMQMLMAGWGQLRPDGNNCAICGDSGHQAWECHQNPLVIIRRVKAAESKWRCFHCGEVFDDSEAARQHFGNIPSATPRCILCPHRDECKVPNQWRKETPDEQGYWWWWDEDGPPIPVNIFVNGTGKPRYFATIGQHGWNRAQWVEDMGGMWMRLPEPEVPESV